MHGESHSFSVMSLTKPLKLRPDAASDTSRRNNRRVAMQRKLRRDAFSATSCHHLEIETMGSRGLEDKVIFVLLILYIKHSREEEKY